MKLKSLLIKSKIGIGMALIGALLYSCDMLHDDMDDCGLYLRFKYDYNMKKTDLFAQQVKRVDVFFFNEKGVLQEHLFEEGTALSDPAYRMDISQLPRKNYQIVTWAGLSDDYELNFEKGTATINDLKLNLLHGGKLRSEIYSNEQSDLWFGNYSIGKKDWKNDTKEIHLTKDVNTFHISLSNDGKQMNEAQLRNYTIQIISGRGEYNFSNEPLSTDDFAYAPYEYKANEEQWMANIKTMRVLENHPARLIIRTNDGKVIADMDLLYYIKEGSFKGEGQGMTFSQYLDWQDHFYIQLDIYAYVAISITINGWTVWLQGTDI